VGGTAWEKSAFHRVTGGESSCGIYGPDGGIFL